MSEHAGHAPWRFDKDADGELCSLESEQLSLLPYNASPTHCDCDLRLACSYGDADDLLRMLNTHGQLLAELQELRTTLMLTHDNICREIKTSERAANRWDGVPQLLRARIDKAAAAIAAAKANH